MLTRPAPSRQRPRTLPQGQGLARLRNCTLVRCPSRMTAHDCQTSACRRPSRRSPPTDDYSSLEETSTDRDRGAHRRPPSSSLCKWRYSCRTLSTSDGRLPTQTRRDQLSLYTEQRKTPAVSWSRLPPRSTCKSRRFTLFSVCGQLVTTRLRGQSSIRRR